MLNTLKSLTLAAALALPLSTAVTAQDLTIEQIVASPQFKQAIAKYIADNPLQIRDALYSADKVEYENSLKTLETNFKKYGHYLTDPDQTFAAVAGEKNAPVHLVEFFDFNCPACISAHEQIYASQKNGSARVTYVSAPFKGHDSIFKTRMLLAISEMGKFTPDVITMLYDMPHQRDPATANYSHHLAEFSNIFGLDLAKLTEMTRVKTPDEYYQLMLQTAGKLGITGFKNSLDQFLATSNRKLDGLFTSHVLVAANIDGMAFIEQMDTDTVTKNLLRNTYMTRTHDVRSTPSFTIDGKSHIGAQDLNQRIFSAKVAAANKSTAKSR